MDSEERVVVWPEAYEHYLTEHGVVPSREFFYFVVRASEKLHKYGIRSAHRTVERTCGSRGGVRRYVALAVSLSTPFSVRNGVSEIGLDSEADGETPDGSDATTTTTELAPRSSGELSHMELRGARAMDTESMRKFAQQYPSLTDEERKNLNVEIDRNLEEYRKRESEMADGTDARRRTVVTDDGERVNLDTSDTKMLVRYAEQNPQVPIYVPRSDFAEGGRFSELPEVRVVPIERRAKDVLVGLSPMDLPHRTFDMFPLPPGVLTNTRRERMLETMRLQCWTELVNLPVYTSDLLLLLTGAKFPRVSDSFQVASVYRFTLGFLLASGDVRTRKAAAVAWIVRGLRRGKLRDRDVAAFARSASFAADAPFVADDLVAWHRDRRLRPSHADALERYVVEVRPCTDAPWESKRGVVYAEDIATIQRDVHMPEAYETMHRELAAADPTSAKALLGIVYRTTWDVLRSYEVAILRMCHEETCVKGDAIPLGERVRFVTRWEVPSVDEITDEYVSLMHEDRRKITKLRNSVFRSISFADEGSGAPSAFPLMYDLRSFVDFATVVRNVDSEEDDVERQRRIGELDGRLVEQLTSMLAPDVLFVGSDIPSDVSRGIDSMDLDLVDEQDGAHQREPSKDP